MKEVWIKKKEASLAVLLSVVVIILAVYSNVKTAEENYSSRTPVTDETYPQNYGTLSSKDSQQHSKVISETIEGELEKGTFEQVIGDFEALTDYMEGYVKSLHMTYQDRIWSGIMICKMPPTNVTSFTFNARAIIEANGTVTYINISIEDRDASQQNQESTYSTINLYLKETEPQNRKNQIIASIASGLPILTTTLVWITEGLIIGIPLSFASLGIVILFNRGIIPLWKNTLKRPK